MALPGHARVCVIGGGAAGFYSAIACAEAAASRAAARCGAAAAPPGSIRILERSAAVLRKVSISGGGRCNVTHSPVQALADTYPRGAELVARLHQRHGPLDTVRWFEAHGVQLKTEADGRLFPRSDSSACVVGCLLRTAESLGVALSTGTHVAGVEVVDAADGDPRRFRLALEDATGARSELTCGRLIVCCGSAQKRSVKRLLEGAGARLRPTVPSLFSLLFDDAEAAGLQGLEGVTVPDAEVELLGGLGAARRERGPLLFTHGGLSGPAMLRLSAWSAYELHDHAYAARLRVSWAPFLGGPGDVVEAIRAVPRGVPGARPPILNRSVGEKSPWPRRLPARLWQRLVERSGGATGDRPLVAQPWRRFEQAEAAEALAEAVWPQLVAHEIGVRGRRENRAEFVTAGGVDWRQGLDVDRMESLAMPGVHFAGEVVDVDGVTGGFNFQGCWTTGHVAGRAAADAFDDAPCGGG